MPSAAAGDTPNPVTDRPRLSGTADPEVLAARLDAAQDTAPIRKRLATRAGTNLPDGHPSSARDENGNPRPPEPSLADVEILTPPLTDAQWTDHVTDVANRLDKAVAASLTTDLLHTLGPDHEEWTVERARAHREIVDTMYGLATDVPCDRRAIMAGGLGGAGKSTVLEKFAGIDRSQYLTINPDDFKAELARRRMLPDIPGLTPMEASTLAHEESSYLAQMLARRAIADGKNVIWDITMSTSESARLRIAALREADYADVDGIFVDIPVEVSISRAGSRHRHDHELFLAGKGLGGRSVPEAVAWRQHDPEYGSRNRRAFEELKGDFDTWAIYDNSVDNADPVLAERGGRQERQKHGARYGR